MRTLITISLAAAAAAACSRDAAPPAAAPAPTGSTAASAVPTAAAATKTAAAPDADAARRVPTTSPSAAAPALYLEAERLRYDASGAASDAKLQAVLAADPGYARAILRVTHDQAADERAAAVAKARAGLAKLPELERRWIEARIALAEGRTDDSYKETLAIAELAPADWEVQMVAAELTQFHYGKHVEARTYLERAIAAKPDWAPPYNLLAYAHSTDGDLDKAILAITRYAELAPGQPNPLDSKGEILLEAGRFDDAEAAFRAALAIDPKFRAEDGIAAVQLHRGELAAALASYEHAWATQKDQPGLRWELGTSLLWAYLINERYDRALALAPDLEKAAADSGHFRPEAYGHIFRARVAMYREQWKDALAHLDRARATTDGHDDKPTIYMRRTIDQQRVRALLGMKDAKRADAIRAELVAAVADDEPARLASLLVAHQKGDLAAAKAAGKPLFSHRQHGSDAKLLIADVLVTAGHADKAKMLREDVAKSYARDPRSYVLRMKAAKALKKS